MNKQFLHKLPVDHYVQADIISQLYTADKPCSFTVLKPDEIENSLFMYHLRKLVNGGIVHKVNVGYELTPKGFRWINYFGGNGLRFAVRPILLTQFVAIDEDKILLATRKGAVKQVLSPYLLPGGRHEYGLTAHESLDAVLSHINLVSLESSLMTVLESMHESDDGYVHHSIAHIFSVKLTNTGNFTSDKYHYSWHSLDDVTAKPEEYGKLLVWFVQILARGELQATESIRL